MSTQTIILLVVLLLAPLLMMRMHGRGGHGGHGSHGGCGHGGHSHAGSSRGDERETENSDRLADEGSRRRGERDDSTKEHEHHRAHA